MLSLYTPWRWKYHESLKCLYPTTTLHGVTTQKTSTWIFTVSNEQKVQMRIFHYSVMSTMKNMFPCLLACMFQELGPLSCSDSELTSININRFIDTLVETLRRGIGPSWKCHVTNFYKMWLMVKISTFPKICFNYSSLLDHNAHVKLRN
jgi:hypothetical protein